MGTGQVVIAPQKGPQERFISCPCDDIGYGGARGGGKSYGILLDWIAHQEKWGKGAVGILFRRSYPELEDIIIKSRELFPGAGARFNEVKKTWVFPNGSSLKLRFLDKDKDADNYQGHEYNWMAFDELGNWPRFEPLDKLRACLRSGSGIKCRLICSFNPGGVGHNWVKSRYIDPVAPGKVNKLPDGSTRVFIPARVTDNKHLMKNDPGYISRIKQAAGGRDWLVKAWLEGDWDIVAGGALDDVWKRDMQVLPQFDIPNSWHVDRGFDWGSAKAFSVLWFAESDGTECVIGGKKRTFPRGSVIVCREWYGAEEGSEKGLNLTASQIASGITSREGQYGLRVNPGPADNSIFDVSNGNCIGDDMAIKGVRWTKSNKGPGSRKAGLNKLREMLMESKKDRPEDPGLWIMENCVRLISHLPILARDNKNLEDIDTDQPDHDYDVIRYRILKRSTEVKNVKLF